MFDWSGKNGEKSLKSQGILVSCVSGNPALSEDNLCRVCTGLCKVLESTFFVMVLKSL